MNFTNGIPIIDAQEIGNDPHGFGYRLGTAWRDIGFVTLTNHGVDTLLIENCLNAAQGLFALPIDIKMKYHIDGGGGQRGYTPFGIETAKDQSVPDQKEFWHVGRERPADDHLRSVMPCNLWPQELKRFQVDCMAFFSAIDKLAQSLLASVATYLGQSPDYFESRVSEGNSILRLVHYPPCNRDEPGQRAAAHGDINVITLLVGADQAGLEVLRRDGQWIPIHTDPSMIVCNVGDMLERLTNHMLPSTMHRVVKPSGQDAMVSRYSMPYFLHFAPNVDIETLPSCITPETPNLYPEPISAQAFLNERLSEIGLA
ncbi:MAG: isopenicillin N synthase family dioxygenase [Rhodospirillaceae bacterium]